MISILASTGDFEFDLGGKATLFANYYEPVMFDVADNGKPLCQNRKISDCTGFVKVENGAIDFSATEPEKQIVKEYLEGGFYYEKMGTTRIK